MVVHSVLQQEALPNSLARVILEKADGNPLFLEELTWAVMEQGDRRADTVVPDTVQGVLAQAGRSLTEALATFVAMQARFEVARTHLALGELAQHQGNREAVMLHLTEAQHLFQALLVPKYVERTEQRARELGLFFSRSNVR